MIFSHSFWSREVLGINARNLNYVFALNDRHDFPLVDDKLLSKKILAKGGIPHPKLLASCSTSFGLRKLSEKMKGFESFAIKPAHGRGGGGILVIEKKKDSHWLTVGGRVITLQDLQDHSSEILMGVYSLDSELDTVMIEEKISSHEAFAQTAFHGIPDIRIILLHGKPVQAMLRLPTARSGGRANLHQGGIGTGIDLANGNALHSMCKGKRIERHPDTDADLSQISIPDWEKMLELSEQTAKLFPLGYLGIDWVLDGIQGPLVLELNARPGIEIQNATGRGLKKDLTKIQENCS